MRRRPFILAGIILFFLFVLFIPVGAQAADSVNQDSYGVMVDGRELFQIKGMTGTLLPAERAKIISERIINVGKNKSIAVEKIKINQVEDNLEIVADDQVLMTITDAEAKAERNHIDQMAQERLEVIRKAVEEYRRERVPQNLLLQGLYGLLLTMGLWCISWAGNFILNRGQRRLLEYKDKISRYSIKIQKFEVVSANQIYMVVSKSIDSIGWMLKAIGLYFYLFMLLNLFPETRKYSNELLGYVITSVSILIEKVVDYLPDFLIIFMIIMVSRYLLKFLYLLFEQVKNGKIHISGFYVEWVDPTYKIIRFLVLALTLISIFPYIPGSQSSAFQGISVFLGILFSLGSTSAVANMIAGIALTYTRAFVIGDRVKIGNHMGDIVEKSLLSTRIRTIKNEEITIPNSIILSGSIINYSTSAKQAGLILNTKITIGYEVSWRLVHELLICAARRTPDILDQPAPFVFQTSLDDFTVAYEINAYTQQPNAMARIYSDLYGNIQDVFNENNVEIMSPRYMALRDGNQSTIPATYLPPEYEAAAFHVAIKSKETEKSLQE